MKKSTVTLIAGAVVGVLLVLGGCGRVNSLQAGMVIASGAALSTAQISVVAMDDDRLLDFHAGLVDALAISGTINATLLQSEQAASAELQTRGLTPSMEAGPS